jgi:hypothetical protein
VKRWSVVVVTAAALLGVYLLVRAVDLLRTGTVRGALLGLGVLLLVLVGGLLVVGEVRLAAADALFARRKAEVEAAPEDWRAWFLLASAYDMARDPQRGRRAMRKAVALERLS